MRDYLKVSPEHDSNDVIRVKISMDGARMSRTTNIVIASFSLLQKDEKKMSSKGHRTIAVVNGPEDYDTIYWINYSMKSMN